MKFLEEPEEGGEGSNEIIETSDKPKVIPIDVIFDILVRVPVKSLTRFKCVSKSWCSLIHSSPFAATYNTRALTDCRDRYSFLIMAHDKSTSQRHFLSAPYMGGSTSQLVTLTNVPSDETDVNILNGLVLFCRENGYMKHNFAFIINPSTHEVLKLRGKAAQPRFSYGNVHICYFFGYDPSTDRYKVLNTRIIGLRTPKKRRIECGLFDLSSCSWKKINPVFPFDLMGDDWLYWHRSNACVNGVIYIFLHESYLLAAFDMREESFSLIPLPQGAIPSDIASFATYEGEPALYFNYPYLMNCNGLLAVICPEKVNSLKVLEIWILEDQENQQWVKEVITLPNSWDGSTKAPRRIKNVIWTGELMFSPKRITRECFQIPLYDMKRRSFRFIEITLSPWLIGGDIEVACHGGYVESILPHRRNP